MTTQTNSTVAHSSFDFIRVESIESLGIEVSEYKHATGLRHYHIGSSHNENVFLIGFKTVPTDSKGVAHILEHTLLCGSKKFPVRDPFFMMTRRSLNTFMNAMTSSDWTAYPFASQNKKDFFNLLEVYLDAVFFSRLDELDFQQEGHRTEFSEPNNPNSDLEYKGVVYNEMKGAMSSAVSQLWQTLTRYLFPETTYHFNSGGEPESIPDLSYDELLAFYRKHYHPSNAIIMTFGDIPPADLQKVFEQNALKDFKLQDHNIQIMDEKRYYSPLRVEEGYALEQDDIKGKTHHVMAWLLGNSNDLDALLEANLLSRVLLDNSASPLRHVLETTKLGTAPSPLCGLEDSNREISFMCGLEGSEPEAAAEFEKLVLNLLSDVANNGVPQSLIDAQLHQLELQQREIGGDSYPYGLNLIISALGAAIHSADPLALLNIDAGLEKLREKVKQPDFIQKQVKALLDNPHRVRLTLRPDRALAKNRDKSEKQRLENIKLALSEVEKQKIIERTAILRARQEQQDDVSILPQVTLSDVPEDILFPESQPINAKLPLTVYHQGTNGLVYHQIIMPLPALTSYEQRLLPFYSYALTELGCGSRSYQENQQYQAEISGGISAFVAIRGMPDNEQETAGFFTLSGKALASKQELLLELLKDSLQKVRFDELERIRELISQIRTRIEQSLTGQGHSLAMMAAVAGMSPAAELSHRIKGLESVSFYKELDSKIADQQQLSNLANDLINIHTKILKMPPKFLAVAEAENEQSALQKLEQLWQVEQKTINPKEVFSLPPQRNQVKQAWITSTQVSFCAKAYPTVAVEHPDAAPLTVLGGFLRNGFLHKAIREQGGAYGSGAGQDSADAAFRFFSYRDPRLQETLDDFDASIKWMLKQDDDEQKLQEAILGVISTIDKPGSPAGEAKQTYHNSLFGRTPEQRKKFRAAILKVNFSDLKRVTATYLLPEKSSIAVLTNRNQADTLDKSFELFDV